MKKFLLALLLLLAATSAEATTRYVHSLCPNNTTAYNPLGNGGAGACTGGGSTPSYSTIANGIAAMSVGDSLYIRAATYAEAINVTSLTGGTALTPTLISAYPGETVIIQPSLSNPALEPINGTFDAPTLAYLTFNALILEGTGSDQQKYWNIWKADHITFQNGVIRNWGGNGVIIHDGSTNITIKNNKIHDQRLQVSPLNRWYGIYAGGGVNTLIDGNEIYGNPGGGMQAYPGPNTGLIIRNNKIHNNDVGLSNVGGITLSGGSGAEVYNNLLYGQGCSSGTLCSSTSASRGIVVQSGSSYKIYNNTIYGTGGYGIEVYPSNTSVEIRGNIVRSSSVADIIGYSMPGETCDRNAFGIAPVDITCTNTLSSDVRFVDAPNAVFGLCRDVGDPHANCLGVSPAIGAVTSGTEPSSTFTTDILGTTRIVPWDFGAYESSLDPPVTDPTPILVAEISCDNTVVDSSGNANHGTLSGGATYSASGKYNSACSFDGTDDYVSIADSTTLDLTHGFTLSAWVFPTAAMTTFKSIMVKNYVYYLYGSSEGYCGAGGILGGYDTGTTSVNACYSTALSANTWTHLEVTYNRTSIIIYRNGVPITTMAASAFIPASSGMLQIGASEFGENFQGLIDEIRIYNYARTADQVVTDMSTPINASVPNTVTVRMASTTMKFASTVVKFGSTTAATPSYILLETGDHWLLETGDKLLSEQ